MCGKFTQMYSWREVVDFSQPLTGEARERDGGDDGNDYELTVTPMRQASVLHLNAEGHRRVTRMRWGWSKSGQAGKYERPDHIRARAETINRLPTFSEAFLNRRGLLIVRTFNEGEELPSGKTKQNVITPNDGCPVGIAVIWKVDQRDDGPFYTFVMVTVPANNLISAITDRMPAVVPQDDWPKWLGEEDATPDERKALLKPFEGDWTMQAQEKPPARPRPPPRMGAFDL